MIFSEDSEGVNEFGVPEQAAKTRPIEAQSTAIARAMASICNDERVCFGGMSGYGGFVHTFSRVKTPCILHLMRLGYLI